MKFWLLLLPLAVAGADRLAIPAGLDAYLPVPEQNPLMHDGSLQTVQEVIDFYDKGGKPNAALDAKIRELRLTAEEKAALAAFLKALNGTVRDGM